ncbi:PREDICTED: squamosa promoter-binding-like protein 9 isoform X2 [Ipomoea nil]|uniref:squamosa promoter-binding-like protein 9 isoform X2 n=1 Tax=Ipomoea nil TaxID=35883 RepID=UPI0001875252|nr:PREDICTED: squamosa promoter-binding-like protein 9 isoform X2 [Ipomoea nil]
MELGSSSSSTSTSADSSSDGLKFGKKVYFEDAGGGSGGSSLPAKRGRSAVAQGGQPPRCQVEGCKADLSEFKAYYSKHKVCGMHSKSPKVIVSGLEQRFCQQCSRFHQLSEFDQVKRSCRRRLAGHNERRRKPPLGSILSTHYGTLSSSMFGNNGHFVMDFASYPYPGGKGSWRPSTNGVGNFLQQPWQRNSEDPPPKLLLLGSDAAARATYPSPCGEYFNGVSDSTRALSLLSNSNQPWGSRNQQPSGLGVNSLLNTDGTLAVHPSGSHAAVINEFSSSPWGFKGNQATTSSDKILPDSHYSGELEMMAHQQTGRAYMGMEYSTGYDSSVQNVHWTL